MVQNLARAVGYNVSALLLAAGAPADFGIVLPAWLGGLPMSSSTIIITIDARTLCALRM